MPLGKAKLDTIEVLISNSLIDSFISHDEFFSVNTNEKGHKKPWNFDGIHYCWYKQKNVWKKGYRIKL